MKLAKVIQLITGYWILALGVSLLILSDLGAGAWDTVFVGFNNQIDLSIGTWSFIIKFILILINAILLKAKPDWKSIIGILLSSIAIDFWMEIVFKDMIITGMISQVILFLLGIILLAFGIATYIRTDMLNGPIDGLMIATSKRFNISLKAARIINECTAALIGFLLGGPVGFGTLIIAFILGYSIQWSMKLLDIIKDKTPLKIV